MSRRELIMETMRALMWGVLPTCAMCAYAVFAMWILLQSGRIEMALSIMVVALVGSVAGISLSYHMLRDLYRGR